jgi:hypothetical protein
VRVSNLGVKPSHFELLLGASPTALFPSARYPAGAPRFAQGIIQKLQRLNLFTRAEVNQRFQAQAFGLWTVKKTFIEEGT